MNGESKNSISETIPIDLYKSKILKNVKRPDKYVVLVDGKANYFTNTKEAQAIVGENVFNSGIQYAISRNIKYKGFWFYKRKDWELIIKNKNGTKKKEVLRTKRKR